MIYDQPSPSNKANYSAYVPRERKENEALGPLLNVWEFPAYVPPKDVPARAGADSHRQYKTRGIEAH